MATPHSLVTGSKSSISTTALQLTTSTMDSRRGVLVKADAANSGTVYVGLSTVTKGADGTDATAGFELSAKESVVIPHLKASEIYVIGSASGQKVYFIIV